jgi:hypothetical protein
MPYMTVKGLGRVEVKKLPKRFIKEVEVLGVKYPVEKEMYKLYWADKYATARARAKVARGMGLRLAYYRRKAII